MTIARKVFSAGVAAGLSVILAGCMGFGSGGGGAPVKRAQTGIEGTWIDAQGTGLSTLSGGQFTSTFVGTGESLASGTYVLTSPTDVHITGISKVRQSRGQPPGIEFNCRLASASQLNCTSKEGTNFVLTRRA
ncbi:hypothetical protein [Mesorhizobium sp. KR9-304]|uniref:hypothetical protein n=1 Tax=Mesorhizobium sp. KR9-304 TaxID=3156614 RepID=UPI0032B3DB8E